MTTPRRTIRRAATDDKIADGVLALIRREGLSAVTIDSVVAETGVAKTTIYRRYADRTELLRGVATSLTPPPERTHEHSAEGMRELVEDIRAIFEDRVGLAAVGTIMAEPGADVEAWREGLVTPLADQLLEYLVDGVEKRVFAADHNLDLIIDLVIGGLFIADTRHGGVPPTWTSDISRMLWGHLSS
ncbi:MAG: helix-turn-helix domain-containing protein [Corynebacterium sp.]|uniref:TetR/AcrR family transcriptional regulator n=1 Tax=Corynebacterium sp. TaxID=1720 RepID=UPI0026DF92C4|nr:helix-turn-helix domain-containing protein [Corynebacterium sp.]MDO5670870.1 helix-turn-helix domain-containing protein [Corynebacterium sp.]